MTIEAAPPAKVTVVPATVGAVVKLGVRVKVYPLAEIAAVADIAASTPLVAVAVNEVAPFESKAIFLLNVSASAPIDWIEPVMELDAETTGDRSLRE